MDKDQFLTAALQNPANEIIAEELFRLALPDAWLVSGCLVQTVWNVLTSARSITASTITTCSISIPIRRGKRKTRSSARWRSGFASRGIAVEARNQARVHLWYPGKHGLPYPELRCSTQGIDRFLTKNTQIGIRRTREAYEVYAPNGYDDVAALIVRPNPGPNFSAANYEAKGGAMEGAVAGDHGAAGGCSTRRPARGPSGIPIRVRRISHASWLVAASAGRQRVRRPTAPRPR
jgi:hypothetical protein